MLSTIFQELIQSMWRHLHLSLEEEMEMKLQQLTSCFLSKKEHLAMLMIQVVLLLIFPEKSFDNLFHHRQLGFEWRKMDNG